MNSSSFVLIYYILRNYIDVCIKAKLSRKRGNELKKVIS